MKPIATTQLSPPPSPPIIVDTPPNIHAGNQDIFYLETGISNMELSPPEAGDNLQVENHDGKTHDDVRHRKTDRESSISTSSALTALEERMSKLEDELKTMRGQDIFYQWETCSRIARGINDFIRGDVESDQYPNLKDAQVIWAKENLYYGSYLPYIFTEWWIYWNSVHPDSFPLISALDIPSLTQRKKEPLPPKLERALTILWYSKYKSLIEVMLVAHNARPILPASFRSYRLPSVQFALDFVRSSDSFSNLSAQSKRYIVVVIESGLIIGPRSGLEYLFLDEDKVRPELHEFHKRMYALLEEPTVGMVM